MIKILAIAAALLTGCAQMTTKRIGDRWLGHNIQEAYNVYGAPASITEMPNGRKLYEWRHMGATRGTSSTSYGQTDVTVSTDSCVLRFIPDPLGTIERFSWEGNAC